MTANRLLDLPRSTPATSAAALALFTAALVGPASATTVELTGRESVSQFNVVAGIGSSTVAFPCVNVEVDQCVVIGSNGSPEPITTLSPRTISLAGSGAGEDTSLFFTTWLQAGWAQTQTYSLTQDGSDAVLAASGSLQAQMSSIGSNSIDPPQPATQRMESWNWQAFNFTLDDAADFTLVGGSTGGQQLEMWFTSPAGETSYLQFVIGNTGSASFANSGTLQAGSYLLRNFRFVMGSVEDTYANSWDYTLTLSDTQVSAVPEPGTAALWAAALTVLGFRIRASRRA